MIKLEIAIVTHASREDLYQSTAVTPRFNTQFCHALYLFDLSFCVFLL